ncbi:MAG TPA: hypothetical protein VKM55_18185 [Candidatus Lokiarchaeia archaeon]|nr:hypothetical protein [Candidatus Lokiarchaeia archaeon]
MKESFSFLSEKRPDHEGVLRAQENALVMTGIHVLMDEDVAG